MRNRICKTRIGLGDGLMVTAVAREIARRADNPSMKLFPYRKHYTGLKRLMKGVEYPLIQCETWVNNPLFIQHPDELTDKRVVPYYYYCWFDPPKRGHFIHEMAKPHGIDELDLRGELFLTDAEKERVDAMNTKAVVIITGYQTTTAIGYPQNINISIARHGPCWLRTPCPQCQADAAAHDEGEIVDAVTGHFGW